MILSSINSFCILHWFGLVRVKVFCATFNNISVISWRSVLLVEETGVTHRHVTDEPDHIMFYGVHLVQTSLITAKQKCAAV